MKSVLGLRQILPVDFQENQSGLAPSTDGVAKFSRPLASDNGVRQVKGQVAGVLKQLPWSHLGSQSWNFDSQN